MNAEEMRAIVTGHADALVHDLTQAINNQQVAEMVEDTAKTTMHAGLSYLACANVETDKAPQESIETWFESRAVKILEAAGLDPMDGDAVRATLATFIAVGTMNSPDEQGTGHERLIGRLQMAKTLHGMLVRDIHGPKVKRSEVIDYLNTAIDTLQTKVDGRI